MTTLDSKQALALATRFRELANAVGDYRFARLARLKAAQQKALDSEERALRMLSEQLITKAVGLALDEIAGGLAGLGAATARANQALAKIATTKRVLAITGKVIELGGAILAKDPAAVGKALEGLAGAS